MLVLNFSSLACAQLFLVSPGTDWSIVRTVSNHTFIHSNEPPIHHKDKNNARAHTRSVWMHAHACIFSKLILHATNTSKHTKYYAAISSVALPFSIISCFSLVARTTFCVLACIDCCQKTMRATPVKIAMVQNVRCWLSGDIDRRHAIGELIIPFYRDFLKPPLEFHSVDTFIVLTAKKNLADLLVNQIERTQWKSQVWTTQNFDSSGNHKCWNFLPLRPSLSPDQPIL